MFPVSVPRIPRVFVMESYFSTVNLYILQLVENSITRTGIFQEVPLLLSQSTGCNAAKK